MHNGFAGGNGARKLPTTVYRTGEFMTRRTTIYTVGLAMTRSRSSPSSATSDNRSRWFSRIVSTTVQAASIVSAVLNSAPSPAIASPRTPRPATSGPRASSRGRTRWPRAAARWPSRPTCPSPRARDARPGGAHPDHKEQKHNDLQKQVNRSKPPGAVHAQDRIFQEP